MTERVSTSSHDTVVERQVTRPKQDSAPAPAPTTDVEKGRVGASKKSQAEQAMMEYQSNLGFTPEVEKVLTDNWAYCWKKDERGNLFIRSLSGDPASPRSWAKWRRYGIVLLASTLNNLVCVCVSGYSTGVEQMQEEFGFGSELGTLGLSLYVLGFAIGPMLLAPLSEWFGRRPVYLVTWFIFVLFQIPLAVAQNLQTILVCRFFQGFFGSAPLANTGGVVHDVFATAESGMAVAIYALSSTDGPPLGNVVSGYIAQQKGWRWLFWVYLIVFGAFLPILYFFMPETRDTILLAKKSAKIRDLTNGMPFYGEHELQKQDPKRLYTVTIVRPFKFLFTEPITYLAAGINGFAYGIIFLSNEAFPKIFGPGNGGHGWTSGGAINLTFGAYAVGSFIGFALAPLQEWYYKRSARGGKASPEARWWSALWATPLIPIGLMIAAWTSYSHVVFIAPLIGFGLFGIGFYVIIAAILNYVVDGYGHYAASALGGVVFVRNIVGAGFPLFAAQMFDGMGNQWALFLLSMVSFLLIPIPIYLFYKGKEVRARSPYCATNYGKED